MVISLGGVTGMVFASRRSREWIWAGGAALLLVLVGSIGPRDAWLAVLRGGNVYAFLVGIMALAEIARHEGLFDWLAGALLSASGGSRARLFGLVYLAGVFVTALLSNDTTAVVLTPAIAAALARTDAPRLPYLYICAFVANAASFLLPISNPANLVVFGAHLPALRPWLGAFAPASLAAIAITYAALSGVFFQQLRGRYRTREKAQPRPRAAGVAAGMVAAAAIALVAAAAVHAEVGLVALAGAGIALAVIAVRDRGVAAFVARHVSWQIIPLVAGLFVIVSALDRAGALDVLRRLFISGRGLLPGMAIALADNLFNNLPVALASGTALRSIHVSPVIGHAAMIAVDLGPNFSVTGSLATLLWVLALRRDGITVTPWQFLRIGTIVTIPALIGALLTAR